MSTKTVSFNYDEKTYFVTYDGKRLGDSRGYDTAEQAREAALSDVNNARLNEDGTRYLVYRPGYARPCR